MTDSAARKALRRIVVDEQPFVCRITSDRYMDTFRAYAAGHHRHPLRISFPRLEAGAPVVEDYPESKQINLYTPVWAATLIRYALSQGWEAQKPGRPYVIQDGFGILVALGFTPTG